MNVLKVTVAIFSMMISGCSINGMPSFNASVVPDSALDNTEKVFAGIPLVLSYEGSTARLNENWLITAKHVRPAYGLSYAAYDKYEHPTCDVALIRYRGDNTVPLGILKFKGEVFNVGYPVSTPLIAVNQGHHIADITLDRDSCLYSATTAPVVSGMSGGGVYNSKGELVGINARIAKDIKWNSELAGNKTDNVTAMLTLLAVKDWIESVIGEELKLNGGQ